MGFYLEYQMPNPDDFVGSLFGKDDSSEDDSSNDDESESSDD